MDQIMECIPNFSEGRDLEKVEKSAGAFRAKERVKLLDYSTDKDHNRCVITAVGEPEALRDAVIEAVGTATALIDMTRHDGQHPRCGAARWMTRTALRKKRPPPSRSGSAYLSSCTKSRLPRPTGKILPISARASSRE